MNFNLLFPLLFVGQLASPAVAGALIQPPVMCGAQYVTRPLRVAVIGNSLAWSPPQPVYSWAQSNGMAATSLQADYAHVTCAALAERRHQSVALLVVQAWALEGAIESNAPFPAAHADAIARFAPDVAVVQFSDNVVTATVESFSAAYAGYLDSIHPKQALICIGPWYDFAQRLADSVQAECTTHGGKYIAIGDLFAANDMRRESFDPNINGGVGSHPNDLGHFEIARRVVLALE